MNWQPASEQNAVEGGQKKMEQKKNLRERKTNDDVSCAMEMIAPKNSIVIEKSTQTVDKHALKRRIN